MNKAEKKKFTTPPATNHNIKRKAKTTRVTGLSTHTHARAGWWLLPSLR